jgi:hypothetical protein
VLGGTGKRRAHGTHDGLESRPFLGTCNVLIEINMQWKTETSLHTAHHGGRGGLGTEGEAGHVPGMVRARDAGVALVVFHRSIVHLYSTILGMDGVPLCGDVEVGERVLEITQTHIHMIHTYT